MVENRTGLASEPLDINSATRPRPTYPKLAATKGLTVRHRSSGIVGKLVSYNPQRVTLRDGNGRVHQFPPIPGGFSANGHSVTLCSPPKGPTRPTAITASGSVADPKANARVARASRILVEGLHDAALVEKVWGDDLRVEGVVVEPLHGVDDLADVVSQFRPNAQRRLGILLDHLVEGTKETHLAARVNDANVLITGHPYVDIWQAVRPQAIGIDSWPVIPKGTDWKTGVCAEFGFTGTPGELWPRILGRVETYKDLEPAMVGAVEKLIDFVTD